LGSWKQHMTAGYLTNPIISPFYPWSHWQGAVQARVAK